MPPKVSFWKKAADGIKSLFRGGGGAAGKAGKTTVKTTVLSWGNAAKVAIVGGAGYLFLSGGLSNRISSILGIPEWLAQMLIYIVVMLFIVWFVRRVINAIRRPLRMGRTTRYYK
jgi:hypothetical protein